MNLRSCVLLSFVMAGFFGCDPVWNGRAQGDPLVTLRGQLLDSPQRAIPTSVRMTLVWFQTDGRPVAQTPVSGVWSAPFPSTWEWSVSTLPPAAALRARADGSHDAMARVISYLDTDNNEQLGFSTADVASTDVVTGTSGTWALWYFDGPVPTTPAGLQRGYNLVEDSSGVAAFSKLIPVPQTALPGLRRNQCVAPSCAELPRRVRLSGSVGRASGLSAISIRVEDEFGLLDNSTVTINDTPVAFDASKSRYTLNASPGPVVAASNQLIARTPDAVDEIVLVDVPGLFAVTAPTFGAVVNVGSPLTVTWSAAPDAKEYEVTLYDSAFVVQAKVATTDLEASVTPSAPGQLLLVVEAKGPIGGSGKNSFVVSYVNQSVSLTAK